VKNHKKIIITIVALAILSTVFHFWVKYRIESNTPPFISAKLDELMHNKELIDSIGGTPPFEFTYNKNDYKLRDMVKYTIKIKGSRRTLKYDGVQVKTSPDNKWVPSEEKLVIE
jgi:hypothetical protein